MPRELFSWFMKNNSPQLIPLLFLKLLVTVVSSEDIPLYILIISTE